MKTHRVYIGECTVFGLGSPMKEFGTFYIGYQANDGEIIQERGRVLVPCTEAEYETLKEQMQDHCVLLITAQKDNNTFESASLLKIDAEPTKEEAAFLQQAALPVTFSDPHFGEFVLDKVVNSFEGSLIFDERSIPVSLNDRDAIETLRWLCTELDAFVAKASAYAADEMLSSGNDWCYDAWASEAQEGEEYTPLTTEEFIRRISLSEVSIENEGAFSLWFNDGDIFWGHAICVIGSKEDGFTDAAMHG